MKTKPFAIFTVSIFLLSSSVMTPCAIAQTPKVQKDNKMLNSIGKKKKEVLDRGTAKVIQEAVNGVLLTREAFQSLEQDNASEAKAKVTEALSEIDAAVAANQDIALLPIEASIRVIMGVYDLPTATAQRDAAIEVLNMGDVQSARALLSPMVDEIDLDVVSIPVITYKEKLNDALGYLENDKKWEARQSLREALSLFVLNTEVVPIPIIEAEVLVDEAIAAEKTDQQKAVDLLKEADNALSLAAVLGYTTKENRVLGKKIKKENKKLQKFEHVQIKKNILQKINNLSDKIKNGTSDVQNKMKNVIDTIKDKLSLK